MHLIRVWYLEGKLTGTWVLGEGYWVETPNDVFEEHKMRSVGCEKSEGCKVEYFVYENTGDIPWM